MKTFFQNFFITLGVIFLIQLFVLTIFFIKDPYGIRPLLFGGAGSYSTIPRSGNTGDNNTSSTQSNSSLSPAQMQALRAFGIDPASVPSPESITPEQEACFESRLGKERVAEIKSGATPTAAEFFKAKDCI
jgi:hypothetical protein